MFVHYLFYTVTACQRMENMPPLRLVIPADQLRLYVCTLTPWAEGK